MKTLQTGTKVLIEATVESSKPLYVTLKTKSAEIFRVSPLDLTVCETAQPVPTPSFKAGQEVSFNHFTSTVYGTILSIHGEWAWVKIDKGHPTTVKLDELRLMQFKLEGEDELDLICQAHGVSRQMQADILAWHQKHSGRVEVSVPSDKLPTKEESEREMKRIFGSVSDKFVLDNYYFGWRTFYQWMSGHFMTRKEQQG